MRFRDGYGRRFDVAPETNGRAAHVALRAMTRPKKPHERAREAKLAAMKRKIRENNERIERLRTALLEWWKLTPFMRSWLDRDAWVVRRAEEAEYASEFGAVTR